MATPRFFHSNAKLATVHWWSIRSRGCVMSIKCALGPVVAALSLSACSLLLHGDAATLIAHRLETEAGALRASGMRDFSFRYVPEGGFDDCSGAYDVQFTERSALVVWCKDEHGTVVSSHTTTYHLRFVKVPRTWNVAKRAGEVMRIELTRQVADVVMTAVQ